jgi:hypothetical protein
LIHEIKQILNFDTPHGVAQALFIIDYGIHENTIWVMALKGSGEVKHYNSEQIKLCRNYTLETRKTDKPK